MGGEVQTAPLGLLGFLGAKVGGITPRDLLQTISPGLDLFEFLASTLGLTSSNSDSLGQTVAGSGATVTVPVAEAWEVICAQASAANGAAALDVQMHVRLSPANSSLPSVIVATVRQTLSANVNGVHALYTPSRPLILPPGTRVIAQLGGTLGTAVDLTCRVLYRPIPT